MSLEKATGTLSAVLGNKEAIATAVFYSKQQFAVDRLDGAATDQVGRCYAHTWAGALIMGWRWGGKVPLREIIDSVCNSICDELFES